MAQIASLLAVATVFIGLYNTYGLLNNIILFYSQGGGGGSIQCRILRYYLQ